MKNLKIKLGLFSLLAILAFSVCLVSCNKDAENLSTIVDEQMNLEDLRVIKLPPEIGKLTSEQRVEYLSGLTEEEFASLQVDKIDNDEIESRGCNTYYPNITFCSGYSGCYPVLKRIKLYKEVICDYSYHAYFRNAGCCNYG